MKMPKFLHCKIKRYLTLAGSREYNCTSIHNTIFGFHSTPQILNIEASGQINISMPPLNDSSRNHRKIGDGVLTQVLIKTKPSSLPDRSIRILTLKTINVKKRPLHYTTLHPIPAACHYGKTEDCRVSKCLPCAFHRAHGKRRLCRAFSG
jgi:hypothetical protein